jgi:hypothetical protein
MSVHELGYDVDGWLEWASTVVTPEILAYLQMKPTASYSPKDNPTDTDLDNMYRDSARDIRNKFPSFRSWTYLSYELAKFPDLELEDIASHVGEARASEFLAMKNINIPKWNDLLEGRATIPQEPMAQWVCLINLGQRFETGNSEKTCAIIADLNPEMVEVFLRIAGKKATQILAKNGKKVDSKLTREALMEKDNTGSPYFPGIQKHLLKPDGRLMQSYKASIKGGLK